MRPTRRGVAVAGVALVAAVMAALYGPRSLNAVILPALIALVAGVLQVVRQPDVGVSRRPPRDGFPGESGTVTLEFEVDDPFPGVVRDALSPGLEGETERETLVGREPVSYEVHYRSRGVQTLGPLRIAAEDVLGLFRRTHLYPERTDVLVYPRVYDVRESLIDGLRSDQIDSERPGRDEFESLREYAPGDALRDIHWKSSAKRDELIVQQFSTSEEIPGVVLVVGCVSNRGDAMAEAAASIAVPLLERDVPVTVVAPDGRLEVEPGDRIDLLAFLARTGEGPVSGAESHADVTIEARREETRVRIGATETTFDRLRFERHEVAG